MPGLSHLVVELRALVVVQDGCIGAAREERVSWLAVDALKVKHITHTHINNATLAVCCWGTAVTKCSTICGY